MPTARLTRRYLRSLASADDQIRWSAAMKLIDGGGWRTRVALERIAERHSSEETRASAAWSLGFRGDTRAAPALARLLENTAERPDVRAHAAEALGHLLPFHGVSPAVEQAVLRGLDDASGDVRFWSAFAAATVGLGTAAPRLRVLAEDDPAEVAGFWTVATEARWALRVLAGDPDAYAELPQNRRSG